MQQYNIDKLEKYRPYYNAWVSDRAISGLPANGLSEILEVIREEFDANYKADLWCTACVGKMFDFAFQQLDGYYESQKTDVIKIRFQ